MASHVIHRWDSIPSHEVAPGISRRYITTTRMTVAHFNLTRGAVVPTHSHDHEQLSYVVRGVLEFNVAGEHVRVGAGEAILIPSWAEHSVTVIEDCHVIDTFAPVRQDWIEGSDGYFRSAKIEEKRSKEKGKRKKAEGKRQKKTATRKKR